MDISPVTFYFYDRVSGDRAKPSSGQLLGMGEALVRPLSFLVADGLDGIGAYSGEVDRGIAFLVNFADQDDHVTFDEVKSKGDLLDALVHAVDAFFGI